jgi:hypothetical protein
MMIEIMGKYIILYFFLVLAVLLLEYPVMYDNFYMVNMLLIAFFSTTVFIYILKKNRKFYCFSVVFMVLMSYCIVHFQGYIDFCLGFNEKNARYYFYDINIAPEACRVSVLGLLSFFSGYLCANTNKDWVVIKFIDRRKQFYSISPLLGISYVLYALFLLTVGKSYLSGVYGGTEHWSYVSRQLYPLFLYSIYSIIIIKYFNMEIANYEDKSFLSYIKNIGYATSFIVFLNIIVCVWIGDRGPVISSLLIYFSYYFIRCKKITFLEFIFLVAVSGIFMLILQSVRIGDINSAYLNFFERLILSFDNITDKLFGGISIFPPTKELSVSVRCLHAAVSEIPSQIDYGLGKYFLYQIISLVPFFGRFVDFSGYNITAFLFTDILSGYYGLYYGYGTTILADFYADFGIFSAMLGMFLVGFVVNLLDKTLFSSRKVSMLTLTIALIYLQQSIYMARNNFLSPLKIAIWCFIFIKISNLFNKQKSY